jgi:hypothetical protein
LSGLSSHQHTFASCFFFTPQNNISDVTEIRNRPEREKAVKRARVEKATLRYV